MKKIIAAILATIMVLSAFSAIAAVTVSAAGNEDKYVWDTNTETGLFAAYAAAGSYGKDENGKIDFTSTPEGTPSPAAQYTENGYEVSADFSSDKGETQRINIMTKKEQNLKREGGISITVSVDQFKYDGDMWFSFSVWDSPLVNQGDSTGKFGQGYTTLIRPARAADQSNIFAENKSYPAGWGGPGACGCQSFISDQSYYDKNNLFPELYAANRGSATNPCTFNLFDWGNGSLETDFPAYGPKFNEDGSFEITFSILYDSKAGVYNVSVNGYPINSAVITDYFNHRFPEGNAYIGFSLQGSGTDCTSKVTIKEYNGQVPTGTDRQEQTGGGEKRAEIIDSATVPEGEPVVFLDSKNTYGHMKETGKIPNFDKLTYTANNDGSFTITPQSTVGSYIHVTPSAQASYEADDFPYFAVMLRNFCTCSSEEVEDIHDCLNGETLDTYYCAGKILKTDDRYKLTTGVDFRYAADDEDCAAADGNDYKLFVFDYSDKNFTGIINYVQLGFNSILMGTERAKFDLCYAGFFRSEDDVAYFADEYVSSIKVCEHENITYTDEIAPTCSERGYTASAVCADCGEVFTPLEAIPPIDHDWQNIDAVAPTCTDNGYSAGRECTMCHTKEREIDPALGHTYGTSFNGISETAHWMNCLRCGAKNETTEAAHTFVEGVCSACEYQEGTDICPHANITDEDWNVVIAATSCKEGGTKEATCPDCGKKLEGNIDPLPHNSDGVIEAKAPTCTSKGAEAGTCCSWCGIVQTVPKEIPATGHKAVAVPGKDPTCTELGITEGKVCEVCGFVIEEQKAIEALGHKYEVTGTETPATCTTAGSKADQTCSVCGDVKKGATIAAPGHKYDNKDDADCNVCGAVREIKKPEEVTEAPVEVEKKGCGSVAGLSVFAVCATISLAGAVCFKKKKD